MKKPHHVACVHNLHGPKAMIYTFVLGKRKYVDRQPMTVNRKSKEEKVKFLKLMGIGKAEDYW